MLLQDAPNLVVEWVQVGAVVWWTQINRDEFGGLVL